MGSPSLTMATEAAAIGEECQLFSRQSSINIRCLWIKGGHSTKSPTTVGPWLLICQVKDLFISQLSSRESGGRSPIHYLYCVWYIVNRPKRNVYRSVEVSGHVLCMWKFNGSVHVMSMSVNNNGCWAYVRCWCGYCAVTQLRVVYTSLALQCVLCTRLKLVQLDVTDEKQIADAYDFVESHVGSEGACNLAVRLFI